MTDSKGGSGASKMIWGVVGGVVLALLVGTSSPWWFEEFFGDDRANTTTTAAPAGDAQGGGNATTTSTVAADEGGSEVAPNGCTAKIENPLASIRIEPDNFSQEIRRIPTGTHPVIEWTTETFVGTESRWLKLQVESDQGWIEDNTILVASTSDECDF